MKKWPVLLLCVFLVILTGCQVKQGSPKENDGNGYSLQDVRGQWIHLTEKPKRIISTTVTADEILLDLVSHDRIIGMDKWVHDPGISMAHEAAKKIPHEVGDNAEYIVSLAPDLVILGESQAKLAKTLENAGVPVFVYRSAKVISGIPQVIRTLGKAVEEAQRAEEMVNQLEKRLSDIQKKVDQIPAEKRKRGMTVLRFGPIGGEGTIIHDVMIHAGVIDVYNEVRPPYFGGDRLSMILSKEEFIQSDLDIIIMGNWSQGGAFKDSFQQLEDMYNDPAYSSMSVIQNRQVVVVPQKYVNCLSHHVADGIEAVYQAVYESGGIGE